MKSGKESRSIERPLMALLLLCFSVSFSGYSSSGNVLSIVHTELVREVAAPKKGKTAAFKNIVYSGDCKKFFAPFDFSVMLATVEMDLQLRITLLNIDYNGFKISLQKCPFNTLLRTPEVPLFSEPA